MIRRWPGQTKEEWMQEYHKDKLLTFEEREKEIREFVAEIKKQDEERKALKESQKREKAENPFENCDHPNSLENSEATILWIVVMAIGAIFKGNWIIWTIATVIWYKYITRHTRKK